jgi:peptidoglycan hydrolase-like protein with peptidoglycan-binding domain
MPFTFPTATLPVQRNSVRSNNNKIIQELVSFAGISVKPDGVFGPATETAVKEFQAKRNLPANGVVDQRTFDALVAPFKRATSSLPSNGRNLRQLVIAYAQQHLAEHPLEIGGQNRGPWVRLYMDGNEGEQWAWCAGFVTHVLKQACDTLGAAMPIKKSFDCDVLVAAAKTANRFLSETKAAQRKGDLAGSFFVVRNTPTDWNHIGVVTAAEPEIIRTIEGNTNDGGDREGFEVCARIRNYKMKDFILLG